MAPPKTREHAMRQLDRAAAIIAAIELAYNEDAEGIDLADLARVAHDLMESARDGLDRIDSVQR